MKYKLMIKQHRVTKLKYLCITKREDYTSYTGSGRRWKRHLKKYGEDIETVLLFSSDDYDEFLQQCMYYSLYYDVVLSEEFANMIPEAGYENSTGYSNFELFWMYADEDLKREIYKNRAQTLKDTWTEYDPARRTLINECISRSSKEFWGALSLEERRTRTVLMREGFELWLDRRDESYYAWTKKKSEQTRDYIANLSLEEARARGRAISVGRLAMTPEAKELRKLRIRATYATGKHDTLFNKCRLIGMGVAILTLRKYG